MKTLVAIVNYKTPELVVHNLKALAEERKEFSDFKVIVVDNDSGKKVTEQIAQAIQQNQWQEWVTLEISRTNSGFAAGNNRALMRAHAQGWKPEHLFLLNPDASVSPGCLHTLSEFMEFHPHVGIVGPQIFNGEGNPCTSAFRFPSVLSEFADTSNFGWLRKQLANYIVSLPLLKKPTPVDWISGAALWVRAEVLKDTGLMDDDYFLYYEETDLCLQARRAGWEVWHLPTCSVEHHEGSSTNLEIASEQRRPDCWFESRALYFEKNHSLTYRYLADTAWVTGHLLCLFRRAIKREKQVPYLLRDFIANWHTARNT